MKSSLQDDAYRHALSVSWPVFFISWGAIFLGLNGLFAGLYWLGGDGIVGAQSGSFSDLFFFSVETFATVGFGDMVPKTFYTRLIATSEAFASIASLALATGMIFTRFTRPHARIVFSPVVAVAQVAGSPTIMVKLGNRRRDTVVEASARLWLIQTQLYEGTEGRRFVELALDKPDHPLFIEAWTLFHTIDTTSPLHSRSEASLGAAGTCFLVTFRGVDERTGQTVTARREYTMGETAWGKRFRATPDLQHDRRAGACLDFELVDAAAPAVLTQEPLTSDASSTITPRR